MEERFANSIELEIAQLSKEIDAKRRELETARGVSFESDAEKEVVRTSLAEKINAVNLGAATPQVNVASRPANSGASYLDDLDAETTEKVNHLIQVVFSKGLDAAIKEAKSQDPYVLDAFHDALVDKMYEELVRRKTVQ